jgi:hypothetical protein
MNNLTAQCSSSTSRVLEPDVGIALRLGITNEYNLACAFCYRDPTRADCPSPGRTFVYFASIQVSDPVTFTARPEMKIRIGLPFAVPW